MSHYLIQQALFDAKTVGELDQLACQKGNISPFELMSRAGGGAFAELLENFGRPDCIHVFCGAGNNGGDGFAVGEFLNNLGFKITIYSLVEKNNITGDSKFFHDSFNYFHFYCFFVKH